MKNNTQSSNQINITGLIIGVVLAGVMSGILIWIVSFLGLGLTVNGIGVAFLAGFAIAVVGGVISWLLSLVNLKLGAGILGAVLNILLGAVVLVIGGKFIPGLTVDGWGGALLASVAIYAISWLLSLGLKQMNKKAEDKQVESDES